MHIRPLDPNKDAEECLNLILLTLDDLQKKAGYTARQMTVWKYDYTPEGFEKSMFQFQYFVAKEKGKIIGMGGIRVEGSKAKISGVYVNPAFQKRGIGKLIMNKLEEYAREKKVYDFFLYAPVSAEPFYKKLGFGNSKPKDICSLTMIYMDKTLERVVWY